MNWFIAHHGIQGQKWGVRNGPPYPLSEAKSKKVQSKSKESSSKKSPNKSNKLTKGEKITTEKLKKLGTETTGTINPNHLKSLDFRNAELNAAANQQTPSGYLEVVSRNDNSAHYQVGRDIATINRNNNIQNSMYAMDHKENASQAAAAANPYFGSNGYVNNCMHCGVATELRTRGYDVTAGYADKGVSAFSFETWFDGAKTKGYSSMEEMKRDLLKNGEGASGVMQGYYGDGIGSGMGGHTVHWSVEGRSLKIQDGQTGKSYNSLEEANNDYHFNTGGCFATRLDNCEPNFDAMAKRGVLGAPNKKVEGFHRTLTNDGYKYYDNLNAIRRGY